MSILLLIAIIVSVGSAEYLPKEPAKVSIYNISDNYNFKSPTKVIALPRKLIEISGLSYVAATDQLVGVNDEKGHFYYLDKNSGEIIKDIDFGKKGDYEGLEVVGNKVYVAKNNGNIYGYNLKSGAIDSPVKTALTPSNDVEGLGYNPSTNQLLLACKGSSKLRKIEITKKTKSVYAFDLKANKLNPKPVFSITDEGLQLCMKETSKFKKWSKKKKSKRLNRVAKFSPSGIAVHPITHDIYMVSAVGELLVILESNGTIKEVVLLDNDIHKQPEGICFDTKGNLFISNEGRGLVAKIYRYDYFGE